LILFAANSLQLKEVGDFEAQNCLPDIFFTPSKEFYHWLVIGINKACIWQVFQQLI
jgi:hypothetical protein